MSFKKKDGIGLIPAVIYISLTEIMLMIPIIFFIVDALKENELYDYVKIIVLSYCAIIIFINSYIYGFKGRLRRIVIKFENFKYNRTISSFWFFLLFPLSTIIGFWVYYILK